MKTFIKTWKSHFEIFAGILVYFFQTKLPSKRENLLIQLLVDNCKTKAMRFKYCYLQQERMNVEQTKGKIWNRKKILGGGSTDIFQDFFLQSILISPILTYILVPVCLVLFWINLGNFLFWSSFPSEIHFSIEMPTMHLLTCNSVVCDLQNFNKGRKLSTKLVLTEVNTVSNDCTQLFFIQELKMTVQFSRHCRFFCKWDEIKCSCYFESLHMIFFYSAGSVSHLTTLSVRKL